MCSVFCNIFVQNPPIWKILILKKWSRISREARAVGDEEGLAGWCLGRGQRATFLLAQILRKKADETWLEFDSTVGIKRYLMEYIYLYISYIYIYSNVFQCHSFCWMPFIQWQMDADDLSICCKMLQVKHMRGSKPADPWPKIVPSLLRNP